MIKKDTVYKNRYKIARGLLTSTILVYKKTGKIVIKIKISRQLNMT